MKLFRGFAVASAVLALVIAVLGSWVRINDAGLTCPDWPLCNGALVPSLHGGVVLEWTHRLVAFLEGFVVLGALVTGVRARKSIAGVDAVLAVLVAVFVLQVSLGGATVLLANSPLSVMLHWGAGMLLLATLTTLAVLALFAPSPDARAARTFAGARDGAAPALAIAAGFAFVTMCVGAYVSSSYAGLACAGVPACDGTLLGHSPAQFVQMLHRIAAVAVAIVAAIATVVAYQTDSPRVRAFATLGSSLVLVQIALGIGNVVWRLPTAMREAHAANACATFLAFVLAAIFATLDPARTRVPATVSASDRARAPRPIASNA